MNVRLKHNFQFTAATYINGKVLFNNYYLNLQFLTQTMDGIEQNIALDRIRHILFNQLCNSVFIEQSHKDAIKKLQAAGLQTVILPEQPVDQIVGIMLYCKLNSITEGRLEIIDVEIASDVGQNLFYCQSCEEDVGPFECQGWWWNTDPYVENVKQSKQSGNIVSLNRKDSWDTLDLHWDADIVIVDDDKK